MSLYPMCVTQPKKMLENLGRWLDKEDPPQKAAAIAVLSGRMPARALEAARLYNQGYAPQIWLSYSVEPGATLEKFSVPYAGEESISIGEATPGMERAA